MMSLRDKDTSYAAKQEVPNSSKATTGASSSSRQWSSGLKNPRIVRVSRTFGGKDRHSKVCTVKGLRDRRIRLSVPTAIQLYDLQDRLGLNQPSKVIDWLIDTTKNDIDKLPPLPIIPGSFSPFNQPTHTSQGFIGASQSSHPTPFLDASFLSSRKLEGININSRNVDIEEEEENQSLIAKLKYNWDSNLVVRSKEKGVDYQGGVIGDSSSNSQVSAQNFFPISASSNTSFLPTPSLVSNPMFNYYHWEPSNLSLTQLGNLGLPSQNDHSHHQGPQSHSNSSPPPSSLALSSSASQLFLYPSMATPSLLPPHASFMNTHHYHQFESDFRQFNRFHLSNSISSSSLHNPSGSSLRPFPLSMSQQPHLNQNDRNHNEDKGDHGA